MNIKIETIPCGAYMANAFLVSAEGRDDCILVDPGDDLNALRSAIARSGKSLSAIMLTHGHFDHILAASPLAKETGAQVYAHADEIGMLNESVKNAYTPSVCTLPPPVDIFAEPYEDTMDIAGMHFEILHTPGHTKGGVCLYMPEEKTMFTGDTLFCAGFGRMDLYGGSPVEMRTSLKKLFAMPADITVYPGHGEFSTIGAERARYHI